MGRDYKDPDGPRWVDVADYCNEVGLAHGGSVRISMVMDRPARSRQYMCVAVQFWPRHQVGTRCFTAQEVLYWPHSDFKSMPAMLVKLILTLDFVLTGRRVAAEAQASF